MAQSKQETWIKRLLLFLLLFILPFTKSNALLDAGLLVHYIGSCILTIFMTLVVLSKKKNQIYWPHSALFIVFVLFLLLTSLRIIIGPSYSDSIFEGAKTLLYFFILLLLIQVYTLHELKLQVPLFLALLGGLLSIFGLIELLLLLPSGELSIPLDTYQIKAVFGHRNMLLQVLFLTFPFQIYQAFITKPRIQKNAFTIVAISTLFLLLILSNRTTWISLIIGCFFILIITYVKKRKTYSYHNHFKKNRRFLFLLGTTTLLLTIGFFTFFTKTKEVEQHLYNSVKTEHGSGKERLELWKRTGEMIQESPLIGIGVARWKIDILKYGNQGLISEDNLTYYQRPHNDFLWITSELGLFGGLLYLTLFVLSFRILLQQLKIHATFKEQSLLFAILFALIGFVIFSILSFPHERIIQNIILICFFALLIAMDNRPQATNKVNQRQRKWIVTSLSFIAMFTLLYIGFQRYHSEVLTKQALKAKAANQPTKVIQLIEEAESSLYQMDVFSTPLSWYSGLEWYHLKQTDSALHHFKQAFNINPYHVHLINDLASAFAENGDSEQAIQYYQKALQIYPNFEASRLNLCAVYFNSNQLDSAYTTIQKIDANTSNPLFKPFLKAILQAKTKRFLSTLPQSNKDNILPNEINWYYQQYKNSLNDTIPIEILIFDSLLQQQSD